MSKIEELTTKITDLELTLTEKVKLVNRLEIELQIEKNEKRRIQKEIRACVADKKRLEDAGQ